MIPTRLIALMALLIACFSVGLQIGTMIRAHGFNATNSTNEMFFGDRWDCGYITNTTTLEALRDCYRD